MKSIAVLLIVFQVFSFSEAYNFSCPAQAQWELRAKSTCVPPRNYTCLYDVTFRVNVYREKCRIPRLLATGYKYVFQPNLNRATCSLIRYQPFIFDTIGRSDCTLLKSFCNSEGQITYTNGTTKSDRTCICNFDEGYTFVNEPNKQCSCNPSNEDCSCYIGINSNRTIGSKDLKCYEDNKFTSSRQPEDAFHELKNVTTFHDYRNNLLLPTNEYRTTATVCILILLPSYILVAVVLYMLQRFIRLWITPKRIDIVNCTDHSIAVRWYINEWNNCLEYTLAYRPEGSDNWYRLHLSTTDVLKEENECRLYTLTTLNPDTNYEIKIRCLNYLVKSQYTNSKIKRTLQKDLTSETASLDTNTESTSFDSIPEEVNAVPPIATCMSSPSPPPPPPPPISNVLPTPSLPINVPDPNQKMKTLSWARIASIEDKSVWNKIQKMKDKVPVNYPELEKLFSCKENTSKIASAVTKNIVERQKAMKIDIFLMKMHKSPDELIEMIRQGSTAGLGLSSYRSLKENLPNPDEADSLREVLPEELKKLSKSDYFVYRLISLPQYELWINIMITIGEIDSLDYISDYVKTISTACDMLMTNESFETFLRYVLHVGLFMNKRKVAGKAVGFDICSMQKLSETKSIDDTVTLLEFLVQEIRKSDSSCLQFVCDFYDTLLLTQRCLLQPATDEFNAIKKKFTELQVQIDAETCQIKDQCFELIQNGKCQIEIISDKLETQQRKSQEVADHFSIQNINVDELFKCCREMCENIDKIQKKVANTNINFKRGGFRATMPYLRRKSTPINFVKTPRDTRLQEILAKQKIRWDSYSDSVYHTMEGKRMQSINLTSETASLDTNTESTSFDSIPEEVNAVPPIATCMSPPSPPPPPPPPISNVLPTPSLPINVPDPNQKMKTLSWARIASIEDKSVWNKIKKMKDKVPVNYLELEKLFSCKENTSKRASAVTKNIVEQQKAMRIDIFLNKMHKSPDELIEMIRRGSTAGLGLSSYRSLKENLPNPDEADSLREVLPEELKKLSKADYFSSRLISLPQYELWINTMITIGEIDSLDFIPDYVKTISTACDMLMTNESFEAFLRYVLLMNKGKVAGKAVEFDICSMQELSETKSIDDTVTLLELLVHEIRKSDSSCLNFVCDFHDTLLHTQRCLLQPATDEFNAIKKKLTELQVQIDADTCQIKDQCFEFIQNGKCQIEIISEKLETQQRKSQEVADHFSIENINVDELFKCCREMCENIDKIQKKVANTNNNFKLGGFRATMPCLRRKSTPTNIGQTAKDNRLQEILAKQKRRCDSIS